MVIPENVVIVIGIILLVSILVNAYFIGALAFQLHKDFEKRSEDFEKAKHTVDDRLKRNRA